ncbi:MAG: cytochrome P450 [Acidimicrobiia bacterium]
MHEHVVDFDPGAFDPLSAALDDSGFDELRQRCPVSRAPSGAWYLARYDDAVAGTKDVDRFVASFREPGVIVPDEEQLISEIPEPRHGHIRRIINSAIAAHRIGRVEPFCVELCEQLLDGLLTEDGPVDLVAEYVMPVPNNVIAHLLGAPPEDFWRWAEWSDEVVGGTYPTKNRNERGEGLAGAHPEFVAYVDELIADRRAEPRDDFITRLVQTEVDGRRLTDVEARTQLVFLFISGNETTRHLIGNLLWRLAVTPGLLERLAAEPELIPLAVEEALRLDPPVKFLMRNCMHTTELHGNQLEVGDKVAFGLASANRDSTHFDEPGEFRLDRPDPRSHLAFGGGPHVCPGAALARLEARVAVEVFVARVAAVTPMGDGAYDAVSVFWAHGPATLPVRLTPRKENR